jgi:DNA-binding CsgD family transcriptional regulator
LERTEQLEALTTSLADVLSRKRGRMVVVRGEAGIGKTALLRAFCESLPAHVGQLWSACDPLFTPRPLGPLLDLAPQLGGEVGARIAGTAKPHDLAAALLETFDGTAVTVLVVEDIHWADEASLDVLRLVGRRVGTVPALVVVSYREEQLDRTHPLRLVLGELAGAEVTRVDLHGLSLAAVERLARGSAFDHEELRERTAGNPFFVTESLAAAGDHVPDTVRDAVLARAARLAPPARAMLDAVAVVPQRAETWLIEALLSAQPGVLEECLTSGMLRGEGEGVAFRHELARLAIEESIPPDERVTLHPRALGALSDPPGGAPDLARLSHHAEGAHDQDAVLRFAPAAAVQASALGSHRESEQQYARALRFADGVAPGRRAELLERFADESFLTDMRIEALSALDEALELRRREGDLVEQGRTQRLRARLLAGAGQGEEGRAAAQEAISLLEESRADGELARAYAVLSQLTMLADEYEPTLAAAQRALDLARQTGDREVEVAALNNLGTAELDRGLPAGRDRLERSLELAERYGLADEVGRAVVNLVAMLSQSRDYRGVDACVERGREYCNEHGLEAWLSYMDTAAAESAFMKGAWDEAADTAEAITRAPLGSVLRPRVRALSTLGLLRARRGDPGAWPLLDQARDIALGIGELHVVAQIAAARSEAAWLAGEPESIDGETAAAFERSVELQVPHAIGHLGLWRWRSGIATAPEELPAPYRWHVEGETRRAAEWWKERCCPYEAALALADSDEETALRDAHETLRGMGARPAVAIVARRLRERGAQGLPRGPRRSTRENPAGLTARQVEVLELLGLGLRNAEIADRLVVSRKTVDHHVSAILAKLGVRTRGEAVAQAARLELTGR